MTVDPTRLRRASFRGVPFFVESEAPQGFGRRIITHEYPKRDEPSNEDMGAKANRFLVKAYVAGDGFGPAAAALLSACGRKGAGTLILPVSGSVQVRCVDAGSSAERNRWGYTSLDLTFVKEGASTAAPFVSILGSRLALGFAQQLGSVLGPAVSAAIGRLPQGWAGEAVRQVALDALAAIDAGRVSANLPALRAASLAAALPDAARSLDTAQGLVDFGTTLANTLRLFGGEEADDTTLLALEGLSEPVLGTPSGTFSAVAAVEVSNSIEAARALAAYAEACAGATARDFASRREAVLWRSRYSRLGAKVVEAAAQALDEPSYVMASDIRGNVVSQISRSLADLAPTIKPSANLSLPSTLWAWRLYRDPARAAEIVEANAIEHASFTPRTFEAAAS